MKNSSKIPISGTQSVTKITSMKSDKLSASKYRTNIEKSKGHQRIETWTGNISSARKTSTLISKSRQSIQSNTSSKISGSYKAYLTNKRVSNHVRKKTSLGNQQSDNTYKNLISSKSASKICKFGGNKSSTIETNMDEKRVSGMYKASDKYLNKQANK